MRIKILENGPYIVTGNIPLKEMIITPKGHHYEFVEGRKLPQSEEYHLCRCGRSSNAPFCDGSHVHSGFNGHETASKKPYLERLVDVQQGHTMQLADDGRCAFARFCHRDGGSIWELTDEDQRPVNHDEALKAAHDCVAGRLTMYDLEGNVLEETFEPEIIILQDPERHASAGIFVKGPIIIEGADGVEYEVRNRVALCRCGASQNKPFCDASHINVRYRDR